MPGQDPARSTRLASALSFLAPLALYTWTAARTVQGGDAAEFGLLGMQGGVAHPPGYPLYSVLARLFGALPIDPPFFRISLASVVCGAAAVAVMQRVCWKLTGNLQASVIAAFAFALTPIQWRLAGIPEVFSLHALLVALSLLCAVRVAQASAERRGREVAALGLVAGLALANHLTIVLCAPLFIGTLIHVFRNDGGRAGGRALAIMSAATLLGMLPYLLLIPWSQVDPTRAMIWGRTGTLRGLVAHMLRQEYGTLSLHADKARESAVSAVYVLRALRALVVDYFYLFSLVGVFGAVVVIRAGKAAGLVLLACLLLSAIVFPSLISFPENDVTVQVAERFFLLPIVLFAPFVAWGLDAALRRYGSVRILAPIVLPAMLVLGWSKAVWRNDTIIQQYVTAIVRHLPPNAVVVGMGDNLLTGMEWRRLVLGVRPDVQYLDPFTMRGGWYYERLRKELPDIPLPYSEVDPHVADLGLLISRYRPVFYVPWLVRDVKDQVDLQQRGLLYQVMLPGVPRRTLDQQRELLEKDTEALGGPLPDPADGWSAETVRGVFLPWTDLIDAYTAAGRPEEAEAAIHRLSEVFSPGLLEHWAGVTPR